MGGLLIRSRRVLPASERAHQRLWRVWRWFLFGLIVILIGVFGWVVASGVLAFKNITTKNVDAGASFLRYPNNVPADRLVAEGGSRINVLLIGIGGTGHKGGFLADTIQVASIDPVNKTLTMLSVPRDLSVSVPGSGRMKINAVYAHGLERCQRRKTCDPEVDPGGEILKKTVAMILDIPIHYFVRVDFAGFKQLVNVLGGIEVYLDKPLNDPHFPDAQLQGYEPLYIPAGLQKMNGDLALKFVRSRHGLNGEGSDFARSRRQQQVIAAIKKKALRLNVLANPKKITELSRVLGNHLKTDLQLEEIIKLVDLIGEIDDSQTVSRVLDTDPSGPLHSLTDPVAGYIIIPRLGANNFRAVQELVHTIFPEPYVLKEQAKVALINASGQAAVATTITKQLQGLGYTIISTTTEDRVASQTTLEVYGDKPYTLALLKWRFSARAQEGRGVPAVAGAELILTIGRDYVLK